jgi:twitching motility protein PilU
LESGDQGYIAEGEVYVTGRSKDLIKKGEIDYLKEAMEQGIQEGCQTFDHVLFILYREGTISLDQALMNADSANNLRLKIKLAGLKTDDQPAPSTDKTEAEKSAGFQIKGFPPSGSSIRKL